MKVICISGHATAGKDSFASLLKQKLEDDGYKVLVTHYADLLKYICKSFFDWDGSKDVSGRSLLQHIGTDVIRAKRPDYWVGFIIDILEFFPNHWDYVLIPDTRFPNEIQAFVDSGFDTTHIRVEREFESNLTPEQQNHPSESALDNAEADFYIHNNGTLADLSELADKWIVRETGQHQTSIDDLRKDI